MAGSEKSDGFKNWTDSEIGAEIEKFKADSNGQEYSGRRVKEHDMHELLDRAADRGISYDLSRRRQD